MTARSRRSRIRAYAGHTVLLAFAITAIAVSGETPSDPTPLLTYAASQNFTPSMPARVEAVYRKRLDRINFDLKRDPPPQTNCAQFLGARRFANLYDDLGGVYSNIGDDARAADAYAKALECNPRATFLHANRASALIDAGRYSEARAEIERELTLGRGNFALHTLITQLDFIDHRWPEAAESARLAVTEAPDDGQATYWQCFLWLAQMHDRVPLPALADRRTFSGWPAPILESLQGAISEAELVDAVSAERDAARRREILSEALYYTGQQRLAAGKTDEASRYFEAVVSLKVLYFIEHHLAAAELARLRPAAH